jgi:superfamily II DNA or RNA helicase
LPFSERLTIKSEICNLKSEISLALPYLIKYVYNSGTEEVIKRGKKIHSYGYVELYDHDELANSVNFRVRDDSYSTYYKVNIQKYNDPKTMMIHCTCPYNLSDICRHEAAALFQLQELLDKNVLGHSDASGFNQRHTVVKMKFIDLRTIRMTSSPAIFAEAETISRVTAANILYSGNERVEASLDYDGSHYDIVLQKNEEKNFDTSCTCNESKHSLCAHKAALFLQLLNAYGPNYFDTIRNWDKEKNKLLEAYGYNINDDLGDKFEFIYKEGKPFLKVIDPSIRRVDPVITSRPVKEQVAPVETIVIPKKAAIVLNANHVPFPYFNVDLVYGETDEGNSEFISKVEKIDLTKFVNIEMFTDADKLLFQQVRKLQPAEVNKYLDRNSPFSGFWENIIHHDNDELPEETKALMIEYLYPKFKKIIEENNGRPFAFLLNKGKSFVTGNLKPITFSETSIAPIFRIEKKEDKGYSVRCFVSIDHQPHSIQENEWASPLLFLYNHQLYQWTKPEDILMIEKFATKELVISNESWQQELAQTILPLAKDYKIDFEKSLTKEIKGTAPEIHVMLIEKGDFLLFKPIFKYKGYEAKSHDKDTILIAEGEKIVQVHRDKEAEKEFIQKLEGLHSQFMHPQDSDSLILKGPDVLKNNWFFLFIDAMKEMKVPVYGFEALKNFKFNTAKPATHIHLSSGLDWFDAKVELSFGEQKIGISDIKKALANKQSFVQLGDGTLGILPEEWLRKYSLLFKVGEGSTDKLKLSKYHLSVIDDLYEKRDEHELSFQLDDKMERIRNYKSIPEVAPPQELDHILRPYQVSGFHWLNYLNEVSWGGILADDMGLGKTVQALSMLRHYHAQNNELKALVVCPTTLIYNWENEIKKFTPVLDYRIHHGNLRTRNSELLQQSNIIITTYGTLRSDIQFFKDIRFDYVILDESQAIKNPTSKVAKAACLLNAKNKLCMSGTPLQNNTFDIYAQMNFLNPGLLGSVEFFRNEFSTPIDKFGEQVQKEHLKKLIYPFILRRTKEQVAKDLPDKTETILFCEMQEEQRKIYDAYRNTYRDKIIGLIDEQGIDRTQFSILQGLMKLRQICDSPAILNEEHKYPNHSIKLEELTREIEENIGDHKALIFSQFLGMLALIKEKMKADNIVYEYFDGSSSPAERERAIQNFQNNDECRVFLISLKAGGVGLNLTAADYVYIVDPWWNPAVEQQAIDRTHRIGQTKNIFAYRMICKDTIEDKILQLQDRKRSLAKELIADDTTFVKSLTKADVEYLFS